MKRMRWPIYIAALLTTSLLFSQLRDHREPEIEKPIVIEATTNHEYVSEVARRDINLYPLFENGKRKLAEYISEKLGKVEHTNPDDYYSRFNEVVVMNTPTSDDLMVFQSKYLIRLYYVLQALDTKDFRKRIGKELELDTEDRICEHGGVFHLQSDGTLEVEMLPDISRSFNGILIDEIGGRFGSHQNDPDRQYLPANPEYTLDLLYPFHFHAHKENYPESAAVSFNDFYGGRGLVFTPLGKEQFNVDIALFDDVKATNDEIVCVNLDLGVYDY